MKKLSIVVLSLLAFAMVSPSAKACTNYLISRGASTDGSTMISYAADSHTLYGELYYRPAADYPEGAMMDIYEWDTGNYLGKIKQARHTYQVIGNMNEFQLSIGETTYTGRTELQDTTGILDYGSLIYITLQRAKTAREAIKVMTELVAEYGYYSTGESMSIADANEVWMFEIIGKGSPKVTKDKKGKVVKTVANKGAVWVAMQVPEGYVGAHANQARITTFPFQAVNNFNDPKQTCFHAADVISFSRAAGLTKPEVKDEEFSFSDTYAPVHFSSARFSEIRVWSMFNAVSKDMGKYWDYVKGNVTHDPRTGYANNRMPLFIKPDKKVSLSDMFGFMRNHLEGTELDLSKDLGAGPFGCPYRWRPLTFNVDGQEYVNERSTATQQTGFSFIAQARNWLPDAIGGIDWFSVDDMASTVFFPMYCGATKVPEAYAAGNGAMMDFNQKSAFWAFSQVSNLAYTRYNAIHPEIAAKQAELEGKYIAYTKVIDNAATELYKADKKLGLQFITDYSVNTGNVLVQDWYQFYGHLFAKYMDGNIKTVAPGQRNPKVSQPGYGKDWNKRIVKDNGEKLKYVGAVEH